MTNTTPPSTPPSGDPDGRTVQLPAGELPPGWSLLGGQYEIVRLIASGGFGITYLARDTLGRDVAVKECFPLGLAQRQATTHTVSATSAGTSEHFETARAQFLREARMLAQLRHPNVVHVQTLFEENGTAYMAMDFIHGRDLQEEIVATEGGIAPMRLLEIARDLLGALDYIHGQSVLHRDIKPQNIRVDQFGQPLLIDFGAARAETQARSRMAGTFRVVTDGYSPHEFYVSGAAQGPHSDLYALAATLHHAITGAAPVAADERASAIATGEADPYEPIADRHPAHDGRLLSLIDRALRMTPGDRPESAAVWLGQLADAPTTILAAPAPVAAAAAPAAEPARSRFLPGLLIGALAMGGAGGAIWATQPEWLSPGMTEMMAEMGRLEAALAEAENARTRADGELASMRTALTEAEANLDRLRNAEGDMAATMAELDAATAARDAAAANVATLEADLADLTTTQEALLAAQTDRDAALSQVTALQAEADADAEEIAALQAAAATATARIATLEADLERATSRISELETELSAATAQAAQLTQMQNDLDEAEAALYTATQRVGTLEQDLAAALEGSTDLAAMQAELQALEQALAASEQERDRLMTEIAAVAPAISDANVGELERLRARVGALETENAALREALARAEAALPPAPPADPRQWVEGPALRVPNGTLALLPRFSWDNQIVALADSTGGIALYDRDTGTYRAHLARGIPDEIERIGFSIGGRYLIANTPSGASDRLYDVQTAREILRFSATTVTSATRAISPDEQYFMYTRARSNGATDVVILPLATQAGSNVRPPERILASVGAGVQVRVSFSQISNDIVVITPDQVRVYSPDGTIQRTVPNRIGEVLAMAPIGQDDGLLVLRNQGEVVIYDNPTNQRELARFPSQARYTSYRLSGDRLSFFRANAEIWEVLDLTTGQLRGSGPIGPGYGESQVSISTDGRMLFIGAAGARPARLLDVATGAEIQQFGNADEGYFSFDNLFLATGTDGATDAQIWRLNRGPAD